MISPILTKSYSPPPVSKREILRYLGCKAGDDSLWGEVEECLTLLADALTYKVVYCEADLRAEADACRIGPMEVKSKALCKNLRGATSVILFGATVGVAIDRLISRYSSISPSRAVILQAIGAERIEALCDAFCADMEKERGISLRPRFSPGYGDLPLSVQRDIFALLDCPRRIGLSLNESLLMSPTKSVTAFAGVDILQNQNGQ